MRAIALSDRQALRSFGCREPNAQQHKERSSCAIEDVGERGAAPKPVAEQRRKPRETETPERAGGDEAQTQRNERRKLGRTVSRDELRHKGEKEQRHLRVQDVREQTLPIHLPKARRGKGRWNRGSHSPTEQHPRAQKDEISRACEFDGKEGCSGCGEESGQTKSGGQCVNQAAAGNAEHRRNARSAALCHAPPENVEGVRPGSQVHNDTGEDKNPKIMDAKHSNFRAEASNTQRSRTKPRRRRLRPTRNPHTFTLAAQTDRRNRRWLQ